MRTLLTLALTTALAAPAAAAVQTKVVPYTIDGQTYKGFLAWDDSVQGKRPGVLVFHEWWGLNDYAKKRTEQLAQMGYVAFAPDMYGNGQTTTHPKDAGKMATEVRKNADVWRKRAVAAFDILKKNDKVDPNKIAAIGYCFGGSTALELAYAGADVKAVVTFHAGLPTPTPEQAKQIKAKLLINNGADDKFVSQASIDKFKQALDAAKVDYRFINYPGAVHSFTVADADKHMLPGMAYNANADKKSWAAMKSLFDQVFGAKK
jgi:dienelactone hydrolase